MIGIIIAIFLIAGFFCSSFFVYRITFFSKNTVPQDIYAIPPGKQYEAVADMMRKQVEDLEKRAYEQVFIQSHDGLRLAARYYHESFDAPLIIHFHGYRGCAVRDFSACSEMVLKEGYNALVVDQRGHGLSQGHTITFGIKERFDCKAWTEYAVSRFGPDVNIVLSGVSMGAATILMASDLKLPSNVCCIIADCPFSSPEKIIRKVCKMGKLPDRLLYPFVVMSALLFGKFRLWESSAVKAVENTKLPVLLIHGEADWFVPCDMSKEIYSHCNSDKRIVTVPLAGHGISYHTDTVRYEKEVCRFIKQYIH